MRQDAAALTEARRLIHSPACNLSKVVYEDLARRVFRYDLLKVWRLGTCWVHGGTARCFLSAWGNIIYSKCNTCNDRILRSLIPSEQQLHLKLTVSDWVKIEIFIWSSQHDIYWVDFKNSGMGATFVLLPSSLQNIFMWKMGPPEWCYARCDLDDRCSHISAYTATMCLLSSSCDIQHFVSSRRRTPAEIIDSCTLKLLKLHGVCGCVSHAIDSGEVQWICGWETLQTSPDDLI